MGQDAVFVARKRVIGNKRQKPMRYIRTVGLGIKTPATAIEGNYVDKKCPFTGNVSIRGRILKGLVISTKMKRTIVVRRDYLHYIKKYRRFEKKTQEYCRALFPSIPGERRRYCYNWRVSTTLKNCSFQCSGS